MNFFIKRTIIVAILLSSSLYAWKMEADTMVVKNTTNGVITHINFRQNYDTVPLVFTLATDVGSDSATIRVNNITRTGFDVYTVEPDGNNGSHAQMSAVPYIAIEEGTHELPDGTKIVASKISTNKFQSKLISGKSWESISLSGFSTTPVVLGQIQSRNSERTDVTVPDAVSQPWMTTAIRSLTSSGFEMALERSETQIGTVQNEDVAYLVMESGLNGGNHYFGSSEAKKIEYESIRSADNIEGWSNSSSGYVVNFSKSYNNPIAIATKNSRDGGDGGWFRQRDISSSSMALVVDEDIANDTDRSHTTEIAGLILFSEPFDVEFVYSGQAEMKINELLYNEVTTGTDNDEFVEFIVTKSGNLNGYILSDQDSNYYRFPSFSVSMGEYVIFHAGTGTHSSSNGVHHFYRNSSTILNNNNDDIVLLKPSKDLVTMADNTVFNAEPLDYVAYGRNSVGSNVDEIPTTLNGVTLTWNFTNGSELKNADDGVSISLSPNGIDSDKSGCWELTGSENASDNGCASYQPTLDRDSSSLINSLGFSNTEAPNIKLQKTSLTIYDPINEAINPKAIPGAIVKYSIEAHNEGLGSTDANTVAIADGIPNNMKLCISTIGQCRELSFVDGTISSELTFGALEYSNNNAVDFSYAPTADAEGFDVDVTNVRVKLNGSFKESDGTNHPNFTIEFYMGIK